MELDWAGTRSGEVRRGQGGIDDSSSSESNTTCLEALEPPGDDIQEGGRMRGWEKEEMDERR